MDQSKVLKWKSFFDVNPILIGIDSNFSFVMQVAKSNIMPITEETSVNLLRLLSIEYSTFFKAMKEMTEQLETTKGVRVALDNFPFDIIVKTALNSERDYWIEQSLPWLKQIGKSHFIDEIRFIKRNKNISQKLRHLLLKL